MNTMHRSLAAVIGAALASAAVGLVATPSAVAQPTSTDPKERAKAFYTEGRKQYNLGNFAKAVELFKKAYEEWPDGAFLFNIGQSYRQLDDCKQSLFFYKRFLSVKKDAAPDVKKEVEGHVKALEDCVKNQDTIRNRPPDGTNPPDDPTIGTTPTGTNPTGSDPTTSEPTNTNPTQPDTRVAQPTGPIDGPEEPEEPTSGAPFGQPKLVSARANFGGALVNAGSLDIPVQLAVSLAAGYPIAINEKLVIDAGAAFGFTPVPWTGLMSEEGNASLVNLLANVGASYDVAPKIRARGELGAGLLFFSGLETGNPFTNNGVAATGTLAMPAFRIAVAGEYAITENVAAMVSPAFSFSPAKDGLKDDISSLSRIEFTVGVGFRK